MCYLYLLHWDNRAAYHAKHYGRLRLRASKRDTLGMMAAGPVVWLHR